MQVMYGLTIFVGSSLHQSHTSIIANSIFFSLKNKNASNVHLSNLARVKGSSFILFVNVINSVSFIYHLSVKNRSFLSIIKGFVNTHTDLLASFNTENTIFETLPFQFVQAICITFISFSGFQSKEFALIKFCWLYGSILSVNMYFNASLYVVIINYISFQYILLCSSKSSFFCFFFTFCHVEYVYSCSSILASILSLIFLCDLSKTFFTSFMYHFFSKILSKQRYVHITSQSSSSKYTLLSGFTSSFTSCNSAITQLKYVSHHL